MSNQNYSAFPSGTSNGLTGRAYAALTLRVPDSGSSGLDAMIEQHLLDEFAKVALAGLLPQAMSEGEASLKMLPETCYLVAEAMMLQRSKPK